MSEFHTWLGGRCRAPDWVTGARVRRHGSQVALARGGIRVTATYLEPPVTDDRILLSVDDAARVMGIGRSLVYELMSTGKLGSVKIATRRLVPRQSIVEFIEQQNAQPLRPGRASMETAGATAIACT